MTRRRQVKSFTLSREADEVITWISNSLEVSRSKALEIALDLVYSNFNEDLLKMHHSGMKIYDGREKNSV